MKKLFLIPLCSLFLHAQNFDTFLENALLNSPYLKANSLNIEQANENASITTRYVNPTLSVEVSSFSPQIGGREAGYRGTLTQAVRLWGVGDSRKSLATAQKKEARSLVQLNRANFIAQLSFLYVKYKSSIDTLKLAKQELSITQKIANISKERFESGTTAKVKYIQAKLDVEHAKNFLNEREAEKITSYFQLLGFAGVSEELELENSYRFTLGSSTSLENSAEIAYIKSQGESALALAKINSNRLEWIKLYGEFEQEPNQSISRVGVEIPLLFFNTKTQEKKIAQLAAKKAQYIANNISNQTFMKLKELEKSLVVLESLSKTTQLLLTSQEELLGMYEDGYKIANVDLIELQMIKNQMIQTKEKAIQIKQQQEQKIIEHNLLTGEYNE